MSFLHIVINKLCHNTHTHTHTHTYTYQSIYRIKATKNLSDEFNYKVIKIRLIIKVFIFGISFAILVKAISFVIYSLQFIIISDDNVSSNKILGLIFIVSECLFGTIITLAFGIFGFCISNVINCYDNSSLKYHIR